MKINLPNGKTVSAKDVDFETVDEKWNEYKLKDGTTLRVKLTVTKVIRADDWDPNTGDPMYIVSSSNIVRTLVPEKLKRTLTIKKDERIEVA